MSETKPLAELYDLLKCHPDLKKEIDGLNAQGELPEVLKIQKQLGTDADGFFVMYYSYSTIGYEPK